MTDKVIYLTERRPDIVALVSARAARDVREVTEPSPITLCVCGSALTYVNRTWQHFGPRGFCPEAEPRQCAHFQCRNDVEIEMVCAGGGPERSCCGCCWVLTDRREARATWPR
jgi:hypothetical protein